MHKIITAKLSLHFTKLFFFQIQTNKETFATQNKINTCASLNQSLCVEQILECTCILEGGKALKDPFMIVLQRKKMIDNV